MATKIKINVGYKVNMGNYETLNLDFGIEDDQRPNETAAEAFDRVYAFVEKRLSAKVAEARGE
jgi:hypothetical protein